MHGTILFIFASIICFSERTPGSLFGALGKVRYLLLCMGLFSCFCGFMYNDFTSIPLKLFGNSCFHVPHEHGAKVTLEEDCVYPVGVDPSWYLGKNELQFMNSLKMKLSVILGVSQMALGLFMKALNSLKFRHSIDFLFEFIPQIILLFALFGFMDLLIILKWLTDYQSLEGAKPPSIITQMIVMSLNFGVQEKGREETELIADQTWWMQKLLITALITVPLMLFVKPIYLNQ